MLIDFGVRLAHMEDWFKFDWIFNFFYGQFFLFSQNLYSIRRWERGQRESDKFTIEYQSGNAKIAIYKL